MSMRPVRVRMAADGSSAWIPMNRYPSSFGVALGVAFSSNKNLTAAVEYALDPLEGQPCNISRSTTTATLTLTNHGLSVGDSIIVSDAPAPLAGTYAVASVTNQNVITYTVTNSGATAAFGAKVIPLRIQVHPVLTGLTADADSNFSVPPTVARLTVSSYVAGYVDLNVVSGGG